MAAATKAGMIRRWQDPEYRELMRAANSKARKGKPLSDANKAGIAKAKTGKPLSPEHRAAISRANKGKPKSPEHRAAISKALFAVMEDENEREKRARK